MSSNGFAYQVSVRNLPFQFSSASKTTSSDEKGLQSPTQGTFGPDGRFYVATLTGNIVILTFDDSYQVIGVQTIDTISKTDSPHILGIAFNPYETALPPRIYVSHSKLFLSGVPESDCNYNTDTFLKENYPYSGKVSIVEGDNFDTVTKLVENLGVSYHDHGINGIAFDQYGDMYVAVGGQTNAGVKECKAGGLPESPFTGAILRVKTSKGTELVRGNVQYVDSATRQPENFQNDGGTVDPVTDLDIEVFSSGHRNSFDLVWTTKDVLYATDNGPNKSYGVASVSATIDGAQVGAGDELNLVLEGNYYGHPNRNRGRYDARQNVYAPPKEASRLGWSTAPLLTVDSSTNGIDEYRSLAFGLDKKGKLFAQNWNDDLFCFTLSKGGRSAAMETLTDLPSALEVTAGPGGCLVFVSISKHVVDVRCPNRDQLMGPEAWDVFPWRAPADGGAAFTIGGVNFAGTSEVRFGDVLANSVSVSRSGKRITGTVPLSPNPTSELLDVTVTSAGRVSIIPKAFRFLLKPGMGKGVWTSYPALPVALGEVAVAAVNGVLYVFGEGSSETFAFDVFSNEWIRNLPQRPCVGNQHAAETINGKVYLFGGLGNNCGGTVQIFDPQRGSQNQWSFGTEVPWEGGSLSTALVGGKVYAAGGIVGSTTTTQAAVYDPTSNTWMAIASMPKGRNHAAAGTDGEKLYVFGGRGPGSGDGNFVANGFDNVQIYNPASNSWQDSTSSTSNIANMPFGRGGTGQAAFLNGEFYVMGGETSSGDGAVAGNVFDRVDAYNPETNSWRLDASLNHARHGIFPVVLNGRIYLPGGGDRAGFSKGVHFEVLKR